MSKLLDIKIVIEERNLEFSRNEKYYVGIVYLNGKWFKEVAGMQDRQAVLTAVHHSLIRDPGFTEFGED